MSESSPSTPPTPEEPSSTDASQEESLRRIQLHSDQQYWHEKLGRVIRDLQLARAHAEDAEEVIKGHVGEVQVRTARIYTERAIRDLKVLTGQGEYS